MNQIGTYQGFYYNFTIPKGKFQTMCANPSDRMDFMWILLKNLKNFMDYVILYPTQIDKCRTQMYKL